MTTALSVSLAGAILVTVTVLDCSPVTTFEPLLPPVLVDTVFVLWMLPLRWIEMPDTCGGTAEDRIGIGVEPARPDAKAGAAASKRPAAARANGMRMTI